MIARLDSDASEITLVDKINELINGYNDLHNRLDPLVAIMNQDGSVDWRHTEELKF